MRFTPDNITELAENEVFVFGSNLAGRHGAGAAKAALSFGAVMGIGSGKCGQTFAIPTKDASIETMPISEIQLYVERLKGYAENFPHLTFLVTKIGCGLAGYTVADMAPLFSGFDRLPNVALPKEFWEHLQSAKPQ